MLKAILAAALSLTLLFSSNHASAQRAKCDPAALSASEQQHIDELIRQAIQFEDHDQLDSAIEMNKQVLGICNDFAPAMTTIAGLYGREGRLNDEIAWAQKAIASDPDFVDGYIDLANGYALTGEVTLARTTLAKAMSVDSINPIPYYTMGVLAEHDADEVTALDWYTKSMSHDSTFPPSYFNAGLIYIETGEFEKALPLIKRVTELDPTDDQAQQVLAKLYMEIVKQREQSSPAPQKLQREGAFKL
jgi:tetratricopeptide (TPR) repeat protein